MRHPGWIVSCALVVHYLGVLFVLVDFGREQILRDFGRFCVVIALGFAVYRLGQIVIWYGWWNAKDLSGEM